MKLPIILIGPMYAGKSSIASALSKKLQIPEVPLDYIAGYYYVKQGIDLLALANIMKSQNFKDYVDFMRAYELNAAVQVATEFQEGIISFGGGHSYFTDQEQNCRRISFYCCHLKTKIFPRKFLMVAWSPIEKK